MKSSGNVQGVDRVLIDGFSIVPLFHQPLLYTSHSSFSTVPILEKVASATLLEACLDTETSGCSGPAYKNSGTPARFPLPRTPPASCRPSSRASLPHFGFWIGSAHRVTRCFLRREPSPYYLSCPRAATHEPSFIFWTVVLKNLRRLGLLVPSEGSETNLSWRKTLHALVTLMFLCVMSCYIT